MGAEALLLVEKVSDVKKKVKFQAGFIFLPNFSYFITLCLTLLDKSECLVYVIAGLGMRTTKVFFVWFFLRFVLICFRWRKGGV